MGSKILAEESTDKKKLKMCTELTTHLIVLIF